NVETALARAEIYSEFSEATRRRLGAAGTIVNLQPEALLFSKGDAGDALFVLLEGEVEVRTSTEAGKDVRLAALKPYAVIGEMAVLDGGERSADVAAIRRSRLVRVSRDAALDALQNETKALLKMVAMLSKRLRRANEQLEDAAVLDLGGKL